jgi:lipopolysaccharide/colanic/teichoic acid biosynthesis glycosyltransferase
MYKGKRLFDIILSIPIALIVILLTPIVGFFIVLNDGFPIFVSLERVSNGKVIKILKFRSMIKNAHQMKKELLPLNERKDGPLFKIKNDPRITPIGKFLRKLRIDEFPQIFNVLKGDLSLVGPRPHEPEEVAIYPEKFKHIPNFRGGITGLSQIKGASGLTFEEEMYWDDYYIKNASFLLDLKIILKTIFIFFINPTGV